MKLVSTLPFILAAALCTAAAPRIDAIRASIAERGARATVAELVTTHHWDEVLAAIDAGRADWIDLAPSLEVGTDGARSEELTISLATALPKNPDAVLAVVNPDGGSVLGFSRVCGMPFIENTADTRSYRAHALAALARAADAPERDACIAALKAHG